MRGIAWLLLFFSAVAMSHTYDTTPPPASWGSRVCYVGASNYGRTTNTCHYTAAGYTFAHCQYAIPSQHGGHLETMGPMPTTAAFITAGSVGTDLRGANLLLHSVSEYASCTVAVRRCASGFQWTATGTYGTCVTQTPQCDSNHHAEAKVGGGYQCVDNTTCPAGKVFSHTTGTCVDECPSGQTKNPTTLECESCPSGRYATSAVPAYGLTAGECLPTAAQCADVKGMVITDSAVAASGTGPANTPVACVALPEPCPGTFGSLPGFNYCQAAKDLCETAGGTYGAAGAGGGEFAQHVCLVNPDPGTTCASGSQNWYEGYGSPDGDTYGFACQPTDPPKNVCDGQKYDCDHDGNVDDQDHNGCLDNGTLNDYDACTPSIGTGSGGEGGESGEGEEGGETEEPNEGEDPLKPPVEGAGDCDPTSQNYAECAGIVPTEKESKELPKKDDVIAGVIAGGIVMVNDIGDAFSDGIADSDSGIEGPSTLTGIIDDLFPTLSCSSLYIGVAGHGITITCDGTAKLREVLGFVLAAYTAFSVLSIALQKTEK